MLADAAITDLDYTRDIAIEAILKIEPSQSGGRWAHIVAKAADYAGHRAEEPGFVLGIELGHLQSYGHVVFAKIGDGLQQVRVSAREREGYVYAIMTWDADERTLSLCQWRA